MAFEDITSGLTLKIPTKGTRNWDAVFKASFATPISSHAHTGSGDGANIDTAALTANAVTGTKIRLANNENLRGRNQAGSADLNIVKANTSDQAEFGLDSLFSGSILGSSTSSNLYSRVVGDVSNLKVSLSGSTLTFNGISGALNSTTNSAYGVLPDATNETQATVVKLTSDVTVTAANMRNGGTMAFGLLEANNWANTVPIYIYLVHSASPLIAFSRIPSYKKSPATGFIGYKDNPDGAEQEMFFLTASDVTATHDDKPCTLIGGFRMIKGATSDPTIQALDYGLGDGIRKDPFVGSDFTHPVAVNGAAASSYFDSSGTVMTFATPANIIYQYQVGLDGMVDVYFSTSDAGAATDGTAGDLAFALPYNWNTGWTASDVYVPVGVIQNNVNGTDTIHLNPATGTALPELRYGISNGFTNIVQSDDWGTAQAQVIEMNFRYRMNQ